MAIGEYRRERYQTASTARQRSLSWGAIVAGVVLAIALQLMLGLLGLGIGLGGVPGSDRAVTALASTAGIWSIAVALIGLFVGAFAAARLGGVTETLDAVLHGAITWAVATLLVVVLLAGTASAVLGGAFGAIGASIEGLSRAAIAMTASRGPDGALPDAIRSDLRSILSAGSTNEAAEGALAAEPTGGDEVSAAAETRADAASTNPAETIATVASGLSETAGDDEREAAVRAIAEASGLSTDAARQKLATYQQEFDQFVREARQAADNAARTVAASSFSAFVALLLGLVVGSLGGLLGRSGSGRTSRDAG
ncbi:hypothetical protein SAMN06297251_10236 [Fulvimarina manganoxydans]|uniref:PhnA-like protein n=1 Tax=Fulvimarina manganoxydans TaxID=937218 RepID=A0A1W1YWN0_9HYPH|nr:hypothetical protein [Fulvimarina manganoxydans]MEE2950835.1 hypothetical protein [Pseudomonadota bacterium]SMC40554.1 hypothetical protein SAMN06297251_10236 [Fulvimarina manganoxydans]